MSDTTVQAGGTIDLEGMHYNSADTVILTRSDVLEIQSGAHAVSSY